jgi:hypothetical protein
MSKILIIIFIITMICLNLADSFDFNEFYKKELEKISKIIINDLIIIIKEQLENSTMIKDIL